MTHVRTVCDEFLAQRDEEESSCLNFRDLPLEQEDAHFLVNFVREHQHAVRAVKFTDCTFEDEETVNFLKEGFATEDLTGVEVGVKLQYGHVRNAGGIFPNAGGGSIRTFPHFRLLVELSTHLDLSLCYLGDDDFGYVVDSILNGSGKRRLKELRVWSADLSSSSLRHATRLAQESKVEILDMQDNPGLLEDLSQVQSFCDDGLKHNKHLKRLDWSMCDANKTALDILCDTLTVNTTLTEVSLLSLIEADSNQQLGARVNQRLDPLLQRNIQMPIVQSLLDRAQEEEAPFATPDDFLDSMLEQHDTFLDSPDLSALYLALRHATVGRQGDTTNPLVLPIAAAMVRQEEQRSSSTRIQRCWRRRHAAAAAVPFRMAIKRVTSLSQENATLNEKVASLNAQLAAFRGQGQQQDEQNEAAGTEGQPKRQRQA